MKGGCLSFFFCYGPVIDKDRYLFAKRIVKLVISDQKQYKKNLQVNGPLAWNECHSVMIFQVQVPSYEAGL